VGRRRLALTRNLGEFVITKRMTQTEKLGLKGQLVAPQPNGPRNGPTVASCHAEARRHCEGALD
jgi:hypothetical protein